MLSPKTDHPLPIPAERDGLINQIFLPPSTSIFRTRMFHLRDTIYFKIQYLAIIAVKRGMRKPRRAGHAGLCEAGEVVLQSEGCGAVEEISLGPL